MAATSDDATIYGVRRLLSLPATDCLKHASAPFLSVMLPASGSKDAAKLANVRHELASHMYSGSGQARWRMPPSYAI